MATSYTNPGGSGDRTASITVTTSGFAGSPSILVNGNLIENVGWFGGNTRIEFQFLTAKVIDEAKFYQELSTTHGDWKWQGSQDGSVWTDIGGSFTLGGSTLQTQTTLAGNTTAYFRYRLELVSGATSTTPYIREFEFKIDEAPGIVRIQATAKVNGSGAVITIPFTTPPTIGNAVVVPVSARANNVAFPAAACTDNYGNTYVQATTIIQTSGTDVACAIYLCESVQATGSSPPFAVTITLAGTTGYAASAIEVDSGTAFGLGVDKTVTAIGSSATPATAATAALTGPDVFAVGVAVSANAQASITVAVVSPTWTQEYEHLTVEAPSEADSRVLTGVAGTTTNASWTFASTGTWAAALATFRAITAAPTSRVTQRGLELISSPILPGSRVTQGVVEILGGVAAGAAPAQVTQHVIEFLAYSGDLLPFTPISQDAVEVLAPSDAIGVRATVLSVDLMTRGASKSASVTQLSIHVMRPVVSRGLESHAVVEYFDAHPGLAGVTQEVVEIFLRLGPCAAGEFPVDIVTPGGACSSGLLP